MAGFAVTAELGRAEGKASTSERVTRMSTASKTRGLRRAEEENGIVVRLWDEITRVGTDLG